MFYLVFLYIAFIIIMIKMRSNSLKLSSLVLPVLFFSVILMIDFALNYSIAKSIVNDTESVSFGILSKYFFREDNSNIYWFYKYYYRATVSSLFLTILYMVMLIFERIREKRK